MKNKIFIILLLMTSILSLTSCGSFANMSNEDAYKYGYNTGVLLRGGSSDEFIR